MTAIKCATIANGQHCLDICRFVCWMCACVRGKCVAVIHQFKFFHQFHSFLLFFGALFLVWSWIGQQQQLQHCTGSCHLNWKVLLIVELLWSQLQQYTFRLLYAAAKLGGKRKRVFDSGKIHNLDIWNWLTAAKIPIRLSKLHGLVS